MKTILVVDDEYALVQMLTELLQDEGYRVVSAGNGRDGLLRLQEENAQLVVTDFMMPIANGRELIRGMRALPALQATPVIMVSATLKSVALEDQNGVVEVAAFVKKPFRWKKLHAAIVELIGPGEKGAK